ncbi:sensor histidine kinase [Roseateles sp. P5_E11]
MPRNSLGLRVLGAYLTGVVVSVVLIAVGLTALLTYRADVLNWRVTDQARAIAKRVKFDDQGQPVGLLSNGNDVDWIYLSLKDELAYRVLDSSGKAVLNSPAGEEFWPDRDSRVRSWEQVGFTFERGGSRIHVATAPLQHDGRTWHVQYAGSARMSDLFHVEFALPLLSKVIALFSLILLVVFGACSYVTLWRTFRPLRDISASATKISPRSLHARLPTDSAPSEVAPLVDSFNRTLDRLERGYRVQQEFLASAAHELKTPLALIRAQVELSSASVERDSLLQDVEHMTRQVQQLLLLAEASELQNYNLAPVDILELAQEVSAYLQRMAQAAQVRMELQAGRSRPTWLADRHAFFMLLKNLVENAIQHSPPGALVSIEADIRSISVRDRGVGATDEQLSRMFIRFWRGAHRRDQGAGLGLAICLEVAEAHGWSLTAGRADPGLRFELTRPDQR